MKRVILFIMLVQNIFLFSQTNCDHNVSTNWNNPTNDALPTDLIYPNGDPRYLNGTNWFPLTPGGSFEDYNLSNMNWSGIPLLEMDNIWSTSIPYYNYINDSPKPIPENGWELLLVNFGRFSNDVDVISSNETFQALPYIVIYNRYSGVLRVFANFGLDQTVGNGPDAVQIELKFKNDIKVSGLARLYDGNDRTLDKTSSITKMKALAKSTNAQRQWFSVDFQVAYDPCTCYYPSELELSFFQVTNETLTLHGRSLSVSDNLIDNELKIDELNFLSGFDYTGATGDQGGILIYKGLQNLVSDYILRFEKYKMDLALVNQQNEIVENNLGALKMLKYMLAAVLTYGIEANSIDVASAQAEEWFNQMSAEYGAFIKKADGTFNIENIMKIAKKVLGSDAKTYIEQNFEKLPLPQAPDKSKIPSVTFTEMHFEGLISDDQIKGGPWFYTPGTYGTDATKVIQSGQLQNPILQTPYNYPTYNEVLGTFALLNSPKITISNRVAPGTVTEKNTQVTLSNGVLTPVYYKSWTKEYQIHLNEDLKFAINSVVDIDNYEVKAAYRLKAKNKYIFTNGQEFNTFIDPVFTTNISSSNKNINVFDPLRSYSNTAFTNDVHDGFGPVLNASCNCFTDETALFQTPFVPIDAFYNMGVGIGLKEEFFQYVGINNYLHESTQGVDLELFDIELVLMVDMNFQTINSNGETNSSFQILSYKIENSEIVNSNVNLISNLNVQFDMKIPNEDLHLGQTIFAGQQVNGCSLNGNIYECRAWNDILISGNLTTNNNYSVNIIAGNKIEVIPEVIILPEIVLSISPSLDYSHPMPMADGIYVQQFCQGTLGGNAPSYQANSSGKIPQDVLITEQLNEQKDYESFRFDFNLYPNPTELFTTVKLASSETVNIQLFDITGKEIEFELVRLDSNLYKLNMPNCEKGIYLVKVTSLAGNQTKQLILQ